MRRKLYIAQVSLLVGLLVVSYFHLQQFNVFEHIAYLENLHKLENSEQKLDQVLIKSASTDTNYEALHKIMIEQFLLETKITIPPSFLNESQKQNISEKINYYLKLKNEKTKLQTQYFSNFKSQTNHTDLINIILAIPTSNAIEHLIEKYKDDYNKVSNTSKSYQLASSFISMSMILLVLCIGYFYTKFTTQELEITVQVRTAELKASNESLENFAHIAAHDLKSPSIKIKMYANAILDSFHETLPKIATDQLDHILKINKRSLKMVDNLLKYAKLSHMAPQFEKIKISQILEDIKNESIQLAEDQNVQITIVGDAEFEGDKCLLIQLFQNLIGNSIKYRKPDLDPIINIHITPPSQDKPNIQIAVSDNGMGVKSDELENIFKDFTRGSSVNSHEGTGIGLSTCKKIVDFHHGQIKATKNETDPENGGLQININFPMLQQSV